MSSSPPTLGTHQSLHEDIDWNDESSLHKREDGGGVLYEFKALRRGSLLELVHYVMLLPEAERDNYAIEKSGDHRLEYEEIAALTERDDYPG